ncbi:MAG: sulfatase [Candidatus Eisenbacteria bacterium]|uniref:Sulfatase n=1 Tax=Eiseniibacteriota bacterium TaxID=2212470 RepID=A0A937XAE9_UNCEI|nr:sulfatase [Candidatus Eisenbacteria bacterium]
MRSRAIRVRLTAILLCGLTLGALGLLEPLLRFWRQYHLLGIPGGTLVLYYLAAGLAVAAAAGVPVTLGLALRPVQWMPLAMAAYYASATAALAGVIVLAPIVRWELLDFRFHLSYAVILPLLALIAGFLVYKATPRILLPLFGWLFGRPSGRFARLRTALLLLLVGLLIPVALVKDARSRYADAGRPARPDLATRPSDDPVQNVLLITIDALRPDHLQGYGYARPTSPNIDSLAAEGTLFTHAFAQANCTELSFGAIYTSLYPFAHGVQRRAGLASRLPAATETIAELMRDAGLRTFCLAPNPYLKREWGLTQGFDRVEEFHYGYRSLLAVRVLREAGLVRMPEMIAHLDVPRARVVVDRAVRLLAETRGQPFFMHVHFMDVHHPYIPPAPYQEMFRTPGATSISAAQFWRRGWPIFSMLPSEEELLPPRDLARLIDLYDGAIRYTDDEIGRLLRELQRLGLARQTMVVLTADHGDEFLEHGDIFHKSPFLYDEVIRVPLIVSRPGATGGARSDALVRHIDLLPTLADWMGLPRVAQAQGSSLRPLLSGEGEWDDPAVFSQTYDVIALRTRAHKLMYDLRHDRSYCFDLIADPEERTNLQGQGEACGELEPLLADFLRQIALPRSGHAPVEIDARTRRTLESIGYVDF